MKCRCLPLKEFANIKGGNASTTAFPLRWEGKLYSGGVKFQNGDTLLARITPCLENGKGAYINFLQEGEIAFGSTEYIVITGKKGYCNEFFYFLIRYLDFQLYAAKSLLIEICKQIWPYSELPENILEQYRPESKISKVYLLFTIDIVKEKLGKAYASTDEVSMSVEIIDVIDLCKATGNKHLLWFSRLIGSHFAGIIAHATYKISAGKIEGINNKIKTIRRLGYGYPDDEYFFLKLFDLSRKDYVRNIQSHRICD